MIELKISVNSLASRKRERASSLARCSIFQVIFHKGEELEINL